MNIKGFGLQKENLEVNASVFHTILEMARNLAGAFDYTTHSKCWIREVHFFSTSDNSSALFCHIYRMGRNEWFPMCEGILNDVKIQDIIDIFFSCNENIKHYSATINGSSLIIKNNSCFINYFFDFVSSAITGDTANWTPTIDDDYDEFDDEEFTEARQKEIENQILAQQSAQKEYLDNLPKLISSEELTQLHGFYKQYREYMSN